LPGRAYAYRFSRFHGFHIRSVNLHSHRLRQQVHGKNQTAHLLLAYQNPFKAFEAAPLDPNSLTALQEGMRFYARRPLNCFSNHLNLSFRNDRRMIAV
jgi:hypothetical protein